MHSPCTLLSRLGLGCICLVSWDLHLLARSRILPGELGLGLGLRPCGILDATQRAHFSLMLRTAESAEM